MGDTPFILKSMKIGIMNNPFENVYEEIEWIGKNNFDFLDLTLEPPLAEPEMLDSQKIKTYLDQYNLGIIGHTCYYLPYAHPIKKLRDASISVFTDYIKFFAKLGVRKINIHTDKKYPEEMKLAIRNFHIESLTTLAKVAKEHDMILMLENTHSGILSTLEDILFILDAVPDLQLHVDLGHAHVSNIDFTALFTKAAKRITHIHISDNDSSYDQHFVLGAGTLDLRKTVTLLQRYNPNYTVTLEVFAPQKEAQREFQLLSRNKILSLLREVS